MSSLLEGKKIIITREVARAHIFSDKVIKHGGIPIEVPLLEIACKEEPNAKEILSQLTTFEWVFFTSANGVDCFLELMDKYNISKIDLSSRQIAVVGHKTEEALKKYAITSDFIPTVYDADTMAEEFLEEKRRGPILLVRGNLSRDVLPERFQQANIDYTCIEVYDTVERLDGAVDLQTAVARDFDFITFTSPSAVDVCYKLIGAIRDHPCVGIGTTTGNRLKELGFYPILLPKEFTISGMIQTMIDYTTKE